ncbi:hypothetical protein HYV50_05320 [Candidatus Pacearchaeota archaeon]|nr:hypothetical protein [Candidatus Pacearchaeota archaeon]
MEPQKTEKNWYDKSYKLLLLIPAIFFLLTIFYLYNFQAKNGDIIYKDVTLTGGTTITVFDSSADIEQVKSSLKNEFHDLNVRGLYDFRTSRQTGFILETQKNVELIKLAIEKFLGYALNQENSSIEFSGATLSAGFYKQLINSIIVAFLLMGCVIFFIFGESRKIKGFALILTFAAIFIALRELSIVKSLSITGVVAGFFIAIFGSKNKTDYLVTFVITALTVLIIFSYPSSIIIIILSIILILIYGFYSVPSIAVIAAAFADIIMTVAVVDLIGLQLSIAGIVAFLLLIGYSVDTDILLTNRVFKSREGKINERIFGAFKTGITMTLTAIAAVTISLFIVYKSSEVLRQIFTIVFIGLWFDIFNTWITNASIVKWYAESKEKEARA